MYESILAPRTRRWLLLVATLAVSALYMVVLIDRGWTPINEGTLGHEAERVLAGELPHRDFDDAYTGGLSEVNAYVFALFGTRLINLRWASFAVFLLWVPTVFFIARRFARPASAALTTLLAVVWSVPNFPEAMPSTYNLYLATFGTAALFRFTETGRRRWIVAAGLIGGLSVLVKIVGLYYVAAALLFLTFYEHNKAVDGRVADARRRDLPFVLLVTVGLALFVYGLVRMVRELPGPSPLVMFGMPGSLLAAFLAAIEWREPSPEPWPRRLERLGGLVLPFVVGCALPIALFLVPYARSNAIGALVHGALINPTRRFRFASASPAPLFTIVAALPWLVLLVPPRSDTDRRRWVNGLGLVSLAVALGVLGGAATRGGRPFTAAWLTVLWAVPVAVVAGCILLANTHARRAMTARERDQLWLLLCLAALCSLVQVPYAGPQYIMYFAPLAILALLALVSTQRVGARAGIIAGFYLLYGLTSVVPGRVNRAGMVPRVRWVRDSLPIPRTGLRSNPIMAATYTRLVGLLRAHSRSGGYTYAAPDCPEVYFLSQLHNPTRTVFDFIDDPTGHDGRVLRTIDSAGVTAVALNTTPLFSPRLDSTLLAGLRSRFPDSAVVAQFVVRWRSSSKLPVEPITTIRASR